MSEFVGFSFCGIHSSKYKVLAISSGGRGYNMPLFAEFNDSVETVDGYDGSYYFGSNYRSKQRPITCFVDGVDENEWRNIQKWLNPKRIGKLTFDESPYKYYDAKVSSTSDFDFTPLSDGCGGHIYKGTFTVTFMAFDPFAYSYVNSVDDYSYFEESQALWYYDSGILYTGEAPLPIINSVINTTNILLYNGGNARTKPTVTITGSADTVVILNQTTNQKLMLKELNNVTIIVDCNKGHVKVSDVLASSFHEGGFIELESSDRVDRYEGITFTNRSNTVIISGEIDLDIVGRYIAVADDWYKITECNFDTGLIALNKTFVGITGEYNISVIDLNEINISGINMNISSIQFDYKFCYL